jgi:hypothetical protein
MLQSNTLDLFQGIVILVLTGALIYLWLTINRLQQTVRRLEKYIDSPPRPAAPQSLPAAPAPTPAPVSAPTAPAVTKAPEAETIDDGVLAAIAAAVAMVVRQPHRIIAIQPNSGAQLAWSAEGRRELYHSHKIR